MRVLFEDKVRAAVIESGNETVSYPAQNLASIFLNELFISSLPNDTVFIDLQINQALNCVFVAGLNAATFDLRITNNLGEEMFAQAGISNSRFVTPVYFDTVLGRNIEITADTDAGLSSFATDDGAYLRMKGVGAGSYYEMPQYLLNNIGLTRASATSSVESPSGQTLTTKMPFLKTRAFTFRELDFDTVQEISDGIDALGIEVPTYWDLFQDSGRFDPPMYAKITAVRDGSVTAAGTYSFGLSIKESR